MGRPPDSLDAFRAHLRDGIVWPFQQRLLGPTEPSKQPPRMNQTRSTNGSLAFQSAKMGRRVWYESQTERRFLLYLDRMHEVIYYQEQPISVEYANNKRRSKYHPDVLVSFRDGTSILIEVKPCIPLLNFDNIIKYDAMLQQCESEGWGAFIGDDRTSLRHLMSHSFKRALLSVLRTELKRRPISSEWLDSTKERMDLTARDVNAAFLQLRLVVESAPFLVRHAEPKEAAVIDRVLRYFSQEEPTAPLSSRISETAPAPRVAAIRAAAHRARSLNSSSLQVQYRNAYNPWTAEEEELLLAGLSSGETIPELAKRLGRKPGAIRSRLKKLNV
jgi:hypothetical protein